MFFSSVISGPDAVVITPRLTITTNDSANLLQLWQAVAEFRATASQIESQLPEALGLDDAGNVIAELEAGGTTVADFDRALAADGVAVSG